MDDDIFEIEVTDLRAGLAPASVPMPLGGAPERGVSPMDTPANTHTVMRPLRGPSPLAARRRTRGRLLAGAGAALAVALVVVLASAAGPRAALGLLFATPTATVTGADTFQVANDAPWGVLVVDGNRIRVGESGFQPFYFRLAGGTHQLVYTAPPFPVLRCQVSVPATPSDTCPLVTTSTVSGFFPNGKHDIEGVRVLDLRATVDNLPAGAKEQLLSAAQALLNDTRWITTVQPGEHYLDVDGRMQVARGPLAATLALGLSIDLNSVANFNGTPCVIICSVSDSGGDFGGWPLLAGVTASWRISAPDGTVVATTPASPPGAPLPFTPVQLVAAWNNSWQVAFATESGGPFGPGVSSGNPADTATAQVLCNIAQMATAGVKTPSTNNGVYGWSGLAAHPADGCVVVNQTSNVTQQLTGQPELLLYRFGVLLAASDLAHQLNPGLPVADGYERTVAGQAAQAALPPQFTTTG